MGCLIVAFFVKCDWEKWGFDEMLTVNRFLMVDVTSKIEWNKQDQQKRQFTYRFLSLIDILNTHAHHNHYTRV